MPVVIKTVPAIHANVGVEYWYRLQLGALLDSAAVELQLVITRTLNDVKMPRVPKGTPVIHDAGPVKTIQDALKEWGDRWSSRFDKAAKQLAKQFAAKSFFATETAMLGALKKAGFVVKFKPTKASMEAYKATVAENVNLIKSIPQQYLTNVQTLVWQSVNRGSDMATLSRKLQKEYGSTESRAALIARDQNNKAKATIENTRRQQLGITRAIWQHSAGGKEPRPTHVAMSGKMFELDKGMYDSDEHEFVLPGQLINCRCTSRAVIPGLEE